ncbi:MAG: NAD-dependent epimerase/dehydratase family protein [Patescibacteria group bacterium]|jgi:NADH dehydrogenase
MNKIFLTGSTGFIGKKLLDKISKNKDNYIICLIRNENKAKKKLSNIKYIEGDLNPSKYFSLLSNCNYIIHLAAELDSKNEDIFRVNVDFTEALISACNKNIKKFIFFSSITAKRNDTVAYSESKKRAEEKIKKYNKPYLIIRPAWVLGKDSRSTKKFISYLKKFPILPIIGNGKTLLQPIYIDDLIEITNTLSFNNFETNKSIEIAGKYPVAYEEFINYFLKRMAINKSKIHLPISICKQIAKHSNLLSLDAVSDFANNTIADISYLKKAYNFTPLDYKEIINKIVE